MKTFVTLLLVGVVVFSISACGGVDIRGSDAKESWVDAYNSTFEAYFSYPPEWTLVEDSYYQTFQIGRENTDAVKVTFDFSDYSRGSDNCDTRVIRDFSACYLDFMLVEHHMFGNAYELDGGVFVVDVEDDDHRVITAFADTEVWLFAHLELSGRKGKVEEYKDIFLEAAETLRQAD